MANTPSSGGAGGAGAGGGDARGVASIGGTFASRGLAAADRTVAAIADRYAPEGAAAHGSVAMRMLGFADRLLAPRLASTQRFSERAVGGANRMGLAMPQWIYPYPWFADDLARMQMARQLAARP